jgi:hypothetical protein
MGAVIDIAKIRDIDDLEVELIDYLEEIAKKVGAKDWEFDEEFGEVTYRQYGISYTYVKARFYFENEDVPTTVATVRYDYDYKTKAWKITDIKVEDENSIIERIQLMRSKK